MRHHNGFRADPGNEQGIALLAGLCLLAAISLLALVATNSMMLQRHMAGNFNEGQQARQKSGFAVLQARNLVFGIAHGTRFTACLQDCFPPPWDSLIRQPTGLPAQPEYEDASWWQSHALEAGAGPGIPGSNEPAWHLGGEAPRFLIEEVFFDDRANAPSTAPAPRLDGIGYYRILARGVGGATTPAAVSEAIVARPWASGNPGDMEIPADAEFCAIFSPWYDCGVLAWRQRR